MAHEPLVGDAEVEESTSPETALPTRSAPEKTGRRNTARWVLFFGALLIVALAGGLVAATLPRLRHEKQLQAEANQIAEALPRVSVAIAHLAPPTSELNLPGNALPFEGTPIYARTNGYLKRWLVDIGAHVNKGQLLAEISAPDVDDQLAQARANLVLAKANLSVSEANLELAKITLARDVASASATSAQTVDQDRAQVKTTTAQVEAAKASIQVNEATVKQYEDLQSFQKITAEFSGIITARTVDPGALITADNPSEAHPLFYLMNTDPLRVFVNVPQVYASNFSDGYPAIIYRPEDPTKQFSGRIKTTAKALDPNTRTLLTQINVPNPKGELQPGMYLHVKFIAPRVGSSILAPSASLFWRPDGTVVAVLDAENRVRYRKLKTGRDFGAEIEVMEGIEAGETVVVHPGDELPEGQKVEPVPVKR